MIKTAMVIRIGKIAYHDPAKTSPVVTLAVVIISFQIGRAHV